MSLSSPFIHRPVGTTLLTIAVAAAGVLGYLLLPVAPLPQVEFPTISVGAALPGASPETMASSVATPLERQFGRIAGITEMTSVSTLGSSAVTLQFDLNRNIDAAARDVQAAINAARSNLPANLPNNPTYRKVNPADAPILILSLTSDTYDKARMYDAASSILQQKISQITGVGQVLVGGGALPAVRVEVNPTRLNAMGLNLEDVRTALTNANANRPKGDIQTTHRTFLLSTTDQLHHAKEYQALIVAMRNGAPIRLGDVAEVTDSIEDIRTGGLADGKPAVMMILFRQPGANIIDTVDLVRAALPQLAVEIPAGMKMDVVMDRTTTIRGSVRDVELSMILSVILVILVVFFFLRTVRATLIPSVAVPISLVGTFGVMYLCGYSIDNLSLMALTISTGFVVDDAIVVIENITRHLEQGMQPMEASLLGAKEIGFTVLSMSTSLVAVFIPILLMGGIVGRLFREFAVTLSVAIGVSLIVSLTTTPMMCAKMLKAHNKKERHGWFYRGSEAVFNWVLARYEESLAWVLRHQFIMLMVTLSTVVLTVFLYRIIPKGYFPQQDTGRLAGAIQADQHTSFQSMNGLLKRFSKTVMDDQAVEGLVAFTGGPGGTSNSGRMFVTLRDDKDRKLSSDEVIGRLRKKLAAVPGATLFLQSTQDLRIGGRSSSAEYQYTLQGDNLDDLNTWAPKLLNELKKVPGLVDLNSDQQNHGLEAYLTYNRDNAIRMNISPQLIDNTLYDAFGQRQVSTMYETLNQYHVVMEVEPQFWQNPDGLKQIYVSGNNNVQVPLASIASFQPDSHPLQVNHSGQFPSATISFNLLPGVSLGDAIDKIQTTERNMGLPPTIHGSFAGTAQAFQSSQANEIVLIIAALIAVYIVLGILYESYVHPITILSTLPSAGVGALLALMICKTELSLIALIGIILLIGIVKKNAIMMIDFAVDTERRHGKSPEDAIFEACSLRFRPIIMTTMAALLGAMPLALGTGTGAELRRPLGISIVGGLICSQILTLYTTPVVYLYLDKYRLWFARMTAPLRATPRPVIPYSS